MKCLVGLAILISVTTCVETNYYDTEMDKVDLGAADNEKWTIVRKTCWRDAADGVRALDHAAQNFDASWTTPAKCRAACESEGYALAAVEYGHECWCGNTIAGHAHPVDDAYCDEPCSGDDGQTCGGFGYMNLWAQKGCDLLTSGEELDPSSIWKPMACYKDVDANHRLLPFQPKQGIEPERMRTVEGCIDACQGHGYDYAGLENGAECWCGARCPSEYLMGGNCDMPCKGNGKQYCGGQHSLFVYTRDGNIEQENPKIPKPYPHNDGDQKPEPESSTVLKDQVKVSAAVPRQIPGAAIPTLPKLPFPLPKLPQLRKSNASNQADGVGRWTTEFGLIQH